MLENTKNSVSHGIALFTLRKNLKRRFSKFEMMQNSPKISHSEFFRHGVVVIITAQFHSTKSELRFCTGSNPAGGMSEICDGEDL